MQLLGVALLQGKENKYPKAFDQQQGNPGHVLLGQEWNLSPELIKNRSISLFPLCPKALTTKVSELQYHLFCVENM